MACTGAQLRRPWRGRRALVGVVAWGLVMCAGAACGQARDEVDTTRGDATSVIGGREAAQPGLLIAQQPALGISTSVGLGRSTGALPSRLRRTPALPTRAAVPALTLRAPPVGRGVIRSGTVSIGTATNAPITLRLHGLGPTGLVVAPALSYRWTAEGTTYRSGTDAQAATRVIPGPHRPLEVVKLIDSITPELRLAYWRPRVFDKVELQYNSPQPGGGQVAVTIVLTSAAILKLEESGPDPGGLMTERVSFIYTAIEWAITDSGGRTTRVGYDTQTNTGSTLFGR